MAIGAIAGILLFSFLFWPRHKPEPTTPSPTLAVSPDAPRGVAPHTVIPQNSSPTPVPTVIASPQPPAPLPTPIPTSSKPAPEKAVVEDVSYLSVNAIPWGYVSIDGNGRMETPVQKKLLKPGPHTIKVFYEPEHLIFTASVDIKPRNHTRCIANFEKENGGVSCH